MKWSEQRAKTWYDETNWIIGVNYVPSTAVNTVEMWQSETYDRDTIKNELALAAKSGFNSCRVFLQFLLWEKHRENFMENFTDFCGIAESCGISVMPCLFDDCAFSGLEPYLGAQNVPRYGVHNSGWVPSPGPSVADDPSKEKALSGYVKDVIGTFKDSKQIIVWDLYNEPGNNMRGEKSLPLVEKAFIWARSVNPAQPLTVGLWEFKDYEFRYAELSDIISYHDYAKIPETIKRIEMLKKYNRPMLCTEWLHRPEGNTFESHLPVYKRESIGVYNWGLVNGKTQTHLSWDTMQGHPDTDPDIWQHDIFYPDGTFYNEDEIKLMNRIKND